MKLKKQNDIWYVICFGWILQGMRNNGKSELENAKGARQLLDRAIKKTQK